MSDYELIGSQEDFIQKYIECGNVMEAARHAYETDGIPYAILRRKALRVKNSAYVKARITELRYQAAKRHEVTIESLTIEYDEAFRIAKRLKKPRDMIAATDSKAKLYGFHITKHEVSGPDGNPIPLVDLSSLTGDQLLTLKQVVLPLVNRSDDSPPEGLEDPKVIDHGPAGSAATVLDEHKDPEGSHSGAGEHEHG